MFGAIVLCVVGIVFVVLGFLIWKKEKIELFHSYHYDNVSAEDKKAFCKISGLGIIVIGLGSLVSGVIIGITDSAWSFIGLALGLIAGFYLLINANAKYNQR